MPKFFTLTLLAALLPSLTACADIATLTVAQGTGPNPVLPEPKPERIPTVHIAPAKGWSGDGKPIAAPGMEVTRFADKLDHPRWLYVLPNGDVLVAESNATAPARIDARGIKGRVMKHGA